MKLTFIAPVDAERRQYRCEIDGAIFATYSEAYEHVSSLLKFLDPLLLDRPLAEWQTLYQRTNQ